MHSWIPLTNSLLRIFARRASREVSYVTIPWCCLHLTLVMGLGPLRKMNKVTPVSVLWHCLTEEAHLCDYQGLVPLAGGVFLTTLHSSVVLNSLTTRSGGGFAGGGFGRGEKWKSCPSEGCPLATCRQHVRAKPLQLWLTLCDLMDYSPPGSSVHGILQARTLEWVATLSSRRSSKPGDQARISCMSCIGGRVLYH